MGFPFHLVLAYTGVAIFVASYMPAAAQVSYAGNVMQYFGEVMGSYHRDVHQPAGKPVSLDALIAESQRQWGGGEVGWSACIIPTMLRRWWISVAVIVRASPRRRTP